MRKEEIAQKNYNFLCLPLGLAILNSDFSIAVIRSLSKPIKLKVEDNRNWGYLIISSQIEDSQRRIFVKKICKSLPVELVIKMKESIQGDLNNKAQIEIEGFCFEFKIMKYEIVTQPNMSIVGINELDEIFGKKNLRVIADLKITSVKK